MTGAGAQRLDRRRRGRADAGRPRAPRRRAQERRTGGTSGLSLAALGLGGRIGGSIRTIVRGCESFISSPLRVADAGLGVGRRRPDPSGVPVGWRRGAGHPWCRVSLPGCGDVRRPPTTVAAPMAPPESLRRHPGECKRPDRQGRQQRPRDPVRFRAHDDGPGGCNAGGMRVLANSPCRRRDSRRAPTLLP